MQGTGGRDRWMVPEDRRHGVGSDTLGTDRFLLPRTLTLRVFASVNAHPPGAIGTRALFRVYAGSFAIAVVVAVVLMLAQRPVFGDLFAST